MITDHALSLKNKHEIKFEKVIRIYSKYKHIKNTRTLELLLYKMRSKISIIANNFEMYWRNLKSVN